MGFCTCQGIFVTWDQVMQFYIATEPVESKLYEANSMISRIHALWKVNK